MWKLLTVAFCLCVAAGAFAEDQVKLSCEGKVVSGEGTPIGGAKVQVYESLYDSETGRSKLHLHKKVTTKTDGMFSLEWVSSKGKDEYANVLVVARKNDLAFDWVRWTKRGGVGTTKLPDMTLKLGKPTVLAGTVVDEAGTPILGAEVRATLIEIGETGRKSILGYGPIDWLIATTDAQGRFRFTNVPPTVRSNFTVTGKGRARTSTWTRSQLEGKYRAGQTDIKIAVPLEAKIEGIILEERTRKPIPNMKLTLREEQGRYYEPCAAIPGEDGRFSIGNLPPGVMTLTLMRPREGRPEWVAKPVTLSTEAGKTIDDVTIELSKGGIVEVTVTDQQNNAPLSEANVGMRHSNTGQYFSGRTDEKGVARVRVLAGTYQMGEASRQGYLTRRIPESAEVVEGETQKLSVSLRTQPKIRGVVLDPGGKPAGGTVIRILSYGGGDFTTGEDGKFEVNVAARTRGSRGAEVVLVARHVQRNLAAVVETEEDRQSVEVNLEPAATLTGCVTENSGEPIPGAQVSAYLHHGRYPSPLTRERVTINSDGRFQLRGVPSGQRYWVYAQADGFGEARSSIELDEDETGSVKLETCILIPANLTISGVVVDDEGKPVSRARVFVHGDHQPPRYTYTDKNGEFVIEQVVGEEISVSASAGAGAGHQTGTVKAKGGDKDVKVILGQRPRSHPSVPKPRSLVGRPLPKLQLFDLKPASELAPGKNILLCFWDFEQRAGRRCIRMLGARADKLQKKGIVVITVHASRGDEKQIRDWMSKNKVNFSLGMIPPGRKQAEQTLARWGVQGIPWLILTDSKHVVRAEGFELGEIDQKLKETGD